MGAVAHQLGDVFGVHEVVLALGALALPVAAAIEHGELEPLVGERTLSVPLLGAGGQ